jgi:hypothetical protein
MPAPTVNIFAPSAQMFSFVARCSALLLQSPAKLIGWAASGRPIRHPSQRSISCKDPNRISSARHRSPLLVCDANERDA